MEHVIPVEFSPGADLTQDSGLFPLFMGGTSYLTVMLGHDG